MKDRNRTPRQPDSPQSHTRHSDADSKRPYARAEKAQSSDFRQVPPAKEVRPDPRAEIPSGVPLVYLKSASFGSFIYDRMVGRVEGRIADGDIVAVVDKWDRMFGWGFYNSKSMIRLRMLTHDIERPPASFLTDRVASAVRLRRQVLDLEKTTDAYRLIHAEGDGLSGLIADRFGEYVVIELFSLAMYNRIEAIEDAIIDAGMSVKNYVIRADEHVMKQEGFSLPKIATAKDRQVVISENGVKFNVQLSRGHKTGFFCDQRENRLALTQFTPGRDVLDMCCYTGGFACYAATLGKAKSVTAVDLDENALAQAQENATLNNADITFHHADAFEFLRSAAKQGKTWPVIVVDPSKFVPRRDLMETGLHKYGDLNRLATSVLAPGGIMLTCSCSGLVDLATFQLTVSKAARSIGKTLQIFRVTEAGPDHPVMSDAPEGAYLKALWCRLP